MGRDFFSIILAGTLLVQNLAPYLFGTAHDALTGGEKITLVHVPQGEGLSEEGTLILMGDTYTQTPSSLPSPSGLPEFTDTPAPAPTETATPTPPEPTAPGSAEPTPTGSPETTDTPPPTITPLPTGTYTPTSTVSVEPTATPSTSTPTPTPTATITPTETPALTPTPTVALFLRSAPPFVTPGEVLNLFWEISGWSGSFEGLQLQLELPPGFTPLSPGGEPLVQSEQGVGAVIASSPNTSVILPVDTPQGRVRLQVAEDAEGIFTISATLVLDGSQLAAASMALQEEGLFLIPETGGEALALDGRVKVILADQAVGEPLELRVRPPLRKERPPYSLSGQPFAITTRGQQSGRDVRQFPFPLTIEVYYDETTLWGDESGLTLFYYDENERTWIPMQTRVDTERNKITAQTDHLTNFDIDIQSWQSARTPTMDTFQVAEFTGAATYSLPLWVPPGPGGLQPSLSLTYNSQVVDSATFRTQASWVGMGWSLDTGYIERDMHTTNDKVEDDTFSILTAGMSSLLLLGADNTYYHTADESFWRVKYDSTNDEWTAWDKVGNQYIFGDSPLSGWNDRATYPAYHANCNFIGNLTWRWPLVRIINVHGVALNFTYSRDQKDTTICGETRSTTVALYPQTIIYPHSRYRVEFVRAGDRGDYDGGWARADARTFYMRSRLTEVRIQHDSNGDGSYEQLVRKYAFTYASTSGHVFPNLIWPAGGKTLTLIAVQEFGLNGASLPATTFTYGDGMHLTQAANGYGGVVTFTYQSDPWSEIGGPASRSLTQEFGDGKICDNGNGDKGDWNARTSTDNVYCDPDREKLIIEGQAIKEIPAYLMQPGAKYRTYGVFKSRTIHGTTVQIGLTDTSAPGANDQWSSSQFIPYDPEGDDDHDLEAQLLLPAGASRGWLLISCTTGDNRCQVELYQLTLLPMRYRVTQKQVTAETGGETYTFSYTYDEPATNDTEHSAGAASSKPYINPYAEFRGHAMVRTAAPGGRITTTFFHQDDARRGTPHTTLVGTQSFWEQFNSLDTDWVITDPAKQKIVRLAGDLALQNNNPSAGWGQSVARASASLTNGKTLFVQFRLSGEQTEAKLRVESSSNLLFGIYAHGAVIDWQYNNGQGLNSGQLLDGLLRDVWYVLQIGVDDQQFLLQVWQRDEPSTLQRFTVNSMPSGASWTFKQWSYNGPVYLDSYSEGKLYTLEMTNVATSTIATGALPIVDGVEVTDLKIYWSRPTKTTTQIFEGDAEWVGRRVDYEYNTADQGGTQYGNLTRTIEFQWNGSSFVRYRATRTQYFPFTNASKYLVGLSGIEQHYRCPGNNCDNEAADLLGATWYLYDGHSSYSTPPSNGIPYGQRVLLRCLNNNCATNSNQRFRDEIYAYDGWGNRTSVTNYTNEGTYSALASSVAQTTITTYDPTYHTYAVSVDPPEIAATTFTYDYALGVMTGETGPNGAATTITASYDNFGRLTKVIKPGDSSTSPTLRITYTDASNHPWVQLEQRLTGSTYTVVRKFYDGLGRLIQTQTAGAALENGTRDIIVNTWYDAYGNVIEQSVPYDVSPGSGYRAPDTTQASTLNDYDVLGRLKQITATDATVTAYTYLDLEMKVTDANGHTTRTLFDIWGRTTQVIPPSGPAVSYTYDEADQLLSASRGGATVSLTYDLAGRKTGISDPDMGSWSYTYDALGNLTSQSDARGCVTALSYDQLNRLTGKVFSAACDSTPDITYTYDAFTDGSNYGRGYRTGMSDASGSTTWKYDTRGRVTEETKVVSGAGTFKTQWGYNSADLVAWLKYPAGDAGTLGEQLTYTYHPQSWLNSASGTATYVQSTVYDAAGRVQGRTLGNNVLVTDYTYFGWKTANGQGRLQKILTTNTTPTTFQDLRYTYDPVGNVLTIKDYYAGSPQTQTFTYDNADRLASAVASGGSGGTYPSETYLYNGSTGNLASKGGVTLTYGDAAHKHAVTSTSNGSSFQYDANGNMISRVVGGQTYTLSYDAENHLTAVSGAATATFVFDGDGNRVKSTINGTTIVYIGNYVEWNDTTGALTKYYYAGSARIAVRGTNLRYLLTDHLGSTTVSITGTGAYHSELRYKPWGETRYSDGTTPTQRQFTGQINESQLGLYFFNARWYDPASGRFTSADSLVPEAGNPQAWDRYAYVYNNPVIYIDPSGHDPCIKHCGFMVDDEEGWSPVKELLRARIRYNEFYEAADLDWPENYNPATDPYLRKASQGEVPGIWASDVMAIYRHYNFTMMVENGWGLEELLVQAASDIGIGFGSVIPGYSDIINEAPAFRPGRLGGPGHRAAVRNIQKEVENVYGPSYRSSIEFQVRTPGGLKTYRYVDVAVIGPTGQPVAFYQVGLSTSRGMPVARERYAINDIFEYGAYNIPIIFIPYR